MQGDDEAISSGVMTGRESDNPSSGRSSRARLRLSRTRRMNVEDYIYMDGRQEESRRVASEGSDELSGRGARWCVVDIAMSGRGVVARCRSVQDCNYRRYAQPHITAKLS